MTPSNKLSSCCNATTIYHTADEGTGYMSCEKCTKPCDWGGNIEYRAHGTGCQCDGCRAFYPPPASKTYPIPSDAKETGSSGLVKKKICGTYTASHHGKDIYCSNFVPCGVHTFPFSPKECAPREIQPKIRGEIYALMDSFLVESRDQDGNERSINKLNQDRHLFVENMEAIIRSQKGLSRCEGYEEGIGEALTHHRKEMERVRAETLREVKREIEIDKEAHSQGRCSFSSPALCSAMHHDVVLFLESKLQALSEDNK